MEIDNLFYEIDDFCQSFENYFKPHVLANKVLKRNRSSSLCLSEIVTIIIYFHCSSYRNFKDYYIQGKSISITLDKRS